ncbi:cell division protein ZapE [Nitrosomonas marina]|uniref:Cell division protein ZapE n=1 Tax=Nitrosomonas marina TaxID=917 RepID=A0A1H8F6N7_9PROT|nr:cell division protein ZapE [Nitrosomonas marina]SEN27571.1 cell division protein ZapE [Nitrosomonas marina]
MTEQSGTIRTPASEYRQLMQDGELKPDADQASAVEALERLHHEISGYAPAGIRRKSWFARFFGRRHGLLEPPRGIYLHGGVGRGKSMLMDLFYSVAPVIIKRRVHFHEFMLEVQHHLKAWHSLSSQQRKRAVSELQNIQGRKIDLDDPIPAVGQQIARNATLLCFDELQITDIADAMVVARLFDELFRQGVVAVATSNRPPDDLYKNGLNRQRFVPFIDRVKAEMEIIALNGPVDYRYDRLKGVETYFYPVNEQTTNALSAAFFRLTDRSVEDRHKVPSGELIVQGRRLFVPKSARGVAVFSFKRLCVNPLGTADYLAIARAYHTVIVVAIPQFTHENASEATRFIHLIDALYEHGVKLLCSADAPPELLFKSGQSGFEFERAVSRLVEMQSENYLTRGHGKLNPE